MSTKKLFFALWPDHRQRERMRDFISPVAKLVEGRAIERRNWHITLAYIGEYSGQLIPSLVEAASEVDVEPFRLRFDKLEYWPRPKIAALVTPIVPPELQALVQQLNHVLLSANVVVEERTYRPHVTVVRNARPFEAQRLAQSAEIRWSEFRLIESIPEPGGVIYRPVDQ